MKFWPLLLALLTAPVASEPVWLLGELSVHYPPFHMLLGQERRGIYADLAQAVLHHARIRHGTRYFTFKRLKRAYSKGDIALSCCTHPAWWEDVGGVDAELFSDPLLEIRDVWVFPRGYAFDPVADLVGKRVALIRAFGYRGLEQGPFERLDQDDVDQILEAVSTHQADAGVLNEWVLLWKLKEQPYALDRPVEQDRVSVHFVVRPEARHLLAPLNASIAALRRDGTLDRIIRSYLPDYRPVIFPIAEP